MRFCYRQIICFTVKSRRSAEIASKIKRVNATRRAWYAVVASRRFVKEVCNVIRRRSAIFLR